MRLINGVFLIYTTVLSCQTAIKTNMMKIKMNDMLLPWIEFWKLNPVQFIIRQLKSLHKPSGRSIREYINNHVKSKICTILTITTIMFKCAVDRCIYTVLNTITSSSVSLGLIERVRGRQDNASVINHRRPSWWHHQTPASDPHPLYFSFLREKTNPLLHKTSHAPFLLCKWPKSTSVYRRKQSSKFSAMKIRVWWRTHAILLSSSVSE